MRQSFATIDRPEFINLQPMEINPLMSKCEIKVLYTGKNDNKTIINKESAAELAKSLRGAPIVGYYAKEDADFTDHGHEITFDHKGIHMTTKTIPYGFVDPAAQVWFQKFQEEDRDTGQTVIREYLMTTGYIWDGQYPEAKSVTEEGRPQSMELDKESVTGHWTRDNNGKLDFFIINDAIFTKLCIVGDKTEPVFEGASVTAPNISSSYTFEDEFKKSLYSMMQQLQYALQGGNEMADTHVNGNGVNVSTRPAKAFETSKEPDPSNIIPELVAAAADAASNGEGVATESTITTRPAGVIEKKKDVAVPNGFIEEGVEPKAEEPKAEDNTSDPADNLGDDVQNGDKPVDDDFDADAPVDAEFTKKKDDDKEEDSKEDSDEGDKDEDDDDKKKKPADKYTKLEANYNALVAQVEAMKNEFALLQQFKADAEAEKKDALIAEFYMLSDEDKKDVIENKNEYSYDDIKAKLAVIAFDKKVNFSLDTTAETDDNIEADNSNVITTFSLKDTAADDTPEWVKMVEAVEKNNF